MRKLIIFSLILAVGLSIFGISQTVESCYAMTNGFIDVIGSAKKEVAPNVANIRFGINAISEDIREGQDKINTTILNIENAICESGYGDCELTIEYSSCYPKFNNGITNYYFNSNVVARTNNIENVNNLIALACENGATSYYNISYELDNYEEIYQEVLLMAKDNAYKKASGINDNISQVGFKEMSIFNYCNDSKIIVEANIRARYEVKEAIVSTEVDDELEYDINGEQIEDNQEDFFNADLNDELDKENYVETQNSSLNNNYQISGIEDQNENLVDNNDQSKNTNSSDTELESEAEDEHNETESGLIIDQELSENNKNENVETENSFLNETENIDGVNNSENNINSENNPTQNELFKNNEAVDSEENLNENNNDINNNSENNIIDETVKVDENLSSENNEVDLEDNMLEEIQTTEEVVNNEVSENAETDSFNNTNVDEFLDDENY